jgi:hypothetical protein
MWGSLKSLLSGGGRDPESESHDAPAATRHVDPQPARTGWLSAGLATVANVIQTAMDAVDEAAGRAAADGSILPPGSDGLAPREVLAVVGRRVDEIDATVQQLLGSAEAYRRLPKEQQQDVENIAIQADNYDQWVQINALLTDAYYILEHRAKDGTEEGDLLVKQMQSRVQGLCDEALDTMEAHHRLFVPKEEATRAVEVPAPHVEGSAAAGVHEANTTERLSPRRAELAASPRSPRVDTELERPHGSGVDARRLGAERLEAERLEAERLEAERLEAERLEANVSPSSWKLNVWKLNVWKRSAWKPSAWKPSAWKLSVWKPSAWKLNVSPSSWKPNVWKLSAGS